MHKLNGILNEDKAARLYKISIDFVNHVTYSLLLQCFSSIY